MSPTGRRYKIVRKSDGKIIWSCALGMEAAECLNMIATEVREAEETHVGMGYSVADYAADYEIRDSLGTIKIEASRISRVG